MAIAFDNSTSASGTLTSTSFSYTCSGSDRLLVLFLDRWTTSGYPSTVSYNGVAMTLLGEHSIRRRWTVYYLINPDSGANTFVLSGLPYAHYTLSLVSYTGVKQSSFPDASDFTQQGTGTAVSTSLTTVADNCWVISGSLIEANVAGEPAAGTATTRRTGTNRSANSASISAFDNNAAKTPAGSVSLEGTSAVSRTQNFLTISIAPSTATATNSGFLAIL